MPDCMDGTNKANSYTNAENTGYSSAHSGYKDFQNQKYVPHGGFSNAQSEAEKSGSSNAQAKQYSYDSQSDSGSAAQAVSYSYDEVMAHSMNGGSVQFMDLLRGIAGGIIGALPGVIVWISLSRFILGIMTIFCPIIITFGVFVGFSAMTRNVLIPDKYKIISCCAIIIAMVLITDKIAWCTQIVYICGNMKEILYKTSSVIGVSKSDIDELFADESLSGYLKDYIGFEKVDFSTCFFNFGDLLDKLNMRGTYMWAVFKSIAMAFGGSGAFLKFGKKHKLF